MQAQIPDSGGEERVMVEEEEEEEVDPWNKDGEGDTRLLIYLKVLFSQHQAAV